MSAAEGGVQCAVCLEDVAGDKKLPCCGRESASSTACPPCMALIIAHGDGVGRCPLCRAGIRMGADGELMVCENQARCRMCCQLRVLESGGGGCCEPCTKGSQCPLEYECSRCHSMQRIGHPMFRYQATPEEWGTTTWACHRGCGTYTNWRISPKGLDELRSLKWELPLTWPESQAALELLREQRRAGVSPADVEESRRAARQQEGKEGAAAGESDSRCALS